MTSDDEEAPPPVEFRDTFHASLGIDLTIQFFRKRIGNCFLYDCLEQRRVGFLNKRGVSKKLPTECLWNPFYQARTLRALGLLLADGTPTVGGGKTF